MKEGETEEEIFQELVHSPSSCISQGGASLKPGARNPIPGCDTGGGGQALGPSTVAVPDALTGLHGKQGS